jgi:hypothetical protein
MNTLMYGLGRVLNSLLTSITLTLFLLAVTILVILVVVAIA